MNRKPCARVGCPNLTKRAVTIYCSRRCGFIAKRTKITINNLQAELPKVESVSWWAKAGMTTSEFYDEARKRFPSEKKAA